MNFEHSDDRRMLAETLSRFIKEQYPFETRDKIAKSARGYSPELWARFAELGAIGALFSEEVGGFGGGAFDIAVVFEQLGRGLVVEPFLGSAVLCGSALSTAGSAAQREVIAGLIDGTQIGAFAHGEPDAMYELSRVDTRAVCRGDGWVLDGSKAVVMQAEAADFFVLSARSAGAMDDEAGISLFVVPAKTPGLSLRGYPTIDGSRAAELTLRGVELGADALLGTEGGGFARLERAVGNGVLALCAESLGAMDAAKEATLDYLRTRKQFGVLIGSFQALQHRMADMLLEIEQARSAVINAAAALGAERVVRERALSAAKVTIGRVGTLVAEESIQMYGGIGISRTTPNAW